MENIFHKIIASDKFLGDVSFTWGYSKYNQLGINTTTTRNNLNTKFLEDHTWKSISNGIHHTAAIKIDGSLWCWGLNNYGQLGTNDAKNVIIPAIISLEENKWKSVSCGYYHTSAISVNK